jgi:SET domain-containing protein
VQRVETGPSRIAGRGLFTAEAIAAGEVALEQEAVGPGPLNHSCEPSLGWADDHTLVAIRDVAAGEELTLDYATVITDPDFVMMCHCETYRCRQVIEGTDWKIPQLQQRYAGHWAPHVQRLIDRA